MVEGRLAAVNAHFNPKQVKVTVVDKVALVQMDPPTKLIFLARPIMQELSEVFLQLERDDAVSVVILTGKGNSFATGANIKEIATMTSKQMLTDDYFERDWWRILPSFPDHNVMWASTARPSGWSALDILYTLRHK